MISNFPLLRLPFLAVDHIVQVMDPLEQFNLCKTSQKLKLRARRFTKNHFLHLKIDSKDLFVEFGDGEKFLKTHVKDTDDLSATILDLTTSFDSKVVVFTEWPGLEWSKLKLFGRNFGLVRIGPWKTPSLDCKLIMSSSRETLNRLMSSRCLYFETSQNLPVSCEDLSCLIILHLLVRVNLNLNDSHFKLILKPWAENRVTFKELKLSIDNELIRSGPEMLEGLNWKEVEGIEGNPKYQIQRADGQKAMVHCTANIFHFYTC